MKLAAPLVLASASPRRRDILGALGLQFEVSPADADESELPGEAPDVYVTRLAEVKARAVREAQSAPGRAYLGADTTVVLDGAVLGKPADRADSARMLGMLRGRWHAVHTGVCVLSVQGEAFVQNVTTEVQFTAFSDETLQAYVDSGEGMDKAGSYGIQELGAGLVDQVRGSYSNVVGLPAAQSLQLLRDAGLLLEWP